MAASNDKFHEADLPKILEAIKEAEEQGIAFGGRIPKPAQIFKK